MNGYSVSYNPGNETYSVYQGEKRIAVKESEADAWRYIQHLAVKKAEKDLKNTPEDCLS